MIRRLFIGLMVVALSAVSQGVAQAHTVGPPGGYYADNATHTFCYASGVGADYKSEFSAAMTTLSSTDMYVDYDSNCDFQTDVALKEISSSVVVWRGQAECTVWESSSVCSHSIVTLNRFQLSTAFQARKTSCHEIGHTVGLPHYNPGNPGTGNTNGCMVSGAVSESSVWHNYSSHERYGHINALY